MQQNSITENSHCPEESAFKKWMVTNIPLTDVVRQSSWEDDLGLRRASSVPRTFGSRHSEFSTASTRPSFKITLPARRFFEEHVRSRDLVRDGTTTLKNDSQNTPVSSPCFHKDNHTPRTSNHALSSQLYTQLLTPPDEVLTNPWIMPPTDETREMAQPKGTVTSEMQASIAPGDGNNISNALSDLNISNEDNAGSAARTQSQEPNQALRDSYTHGGDGAESWLDEAINIALSEDVAASTSTNLVKVLAQILPVPVTETINIKFTSAFPSLISALQNKLRSIPCQYIQVVHAVPPGFPLSHLPTSPPGTPNSLAGTTVPATSQEDYFNTNVFSSAAAVVDRHDKYGRNRNSAPVPSSPLAVPPSSMEFALLERYIPPNTAQEFHDLFSLTGPSMLLDRLLELSPRGGTLLFIYPTRLGAQVFTKNYLDPLLDPILRGIVTGRGLSADIGISVGKMPSAEHLVQFDVMKRKVRSLLQGLNKGNGQFSNRYSILHSSKEAVHIQRQVWTEWFIKQENPRIKEAMTDYYKRGKQLPRDERITHAFLTREILEGLVKREYGDADKPGTGQGIEVGLFVIRRTA